MNPAILSTLCLAAAVATDPAPNAIGTQPTNPAQAEPPRSTADRGLSGVLIYDGRRGTLRAKPTLNDQTPVIVRVGPPNEAKSQRIEYVGAVAGRFDLRDFVELSDGGLVPEDLSLPIEIVSRLPADATTDVRVTDHAPVSLRASYMPWAFALGVVWLSIPAIVFARRRMLRPATIAQLPAPPARTLEDDIRELLSESKARELSTDERARVELLMLRFLRSRGGAVSASLPEYAAYLGRMRADPVAGPLIRDFEAWLHKAPHPAPDANDTASGMARSAALGALARHIEQGPDDARAAAPGTPAEVTR